MELESPPATVLEPMAEADDGFHNDAFSFWKLPEALREPLEISIRSSELLADWYLLERYLPEHSRRPPAGMIAYYALKQGIPVWLRHQFNALVVRTRRRSQFPAWPWETALIELRQSWLEHGLDCGAAGVAWHIGFWPGGKRCCVVLTHDVESPLGFARMERMADLEERYGFRSAWNLPLAQYPLDWNRIARLKSRGFEFGAHGLSHDGKLFRNYQDFLRLAAELQRRSREHGLRGFRSPSTLRRAEWIKMLDFDHDSSFADTDPFEPQPGGTCSIFPFFLGTLVELPYTLPQDHTLLHLLHREPLAVWTAKAQWIAQMGGMILTLVHPDYSGAPPNLGIYEELLKRLADLESSWRALPSAVANWWRRRAQLRLAVVDGQPRISGAEAAAARAVRLEYPVVNSSKGV